MLLILLVSTTSYRSFNIAFYSYISHAPNFRFLGQLFRLIIKPEPKPEPNLKKPGFFRGSFHVSKPDPNCPVGDPTPAYSLRCLYEYFEGS